MLHIDRLYLKPLHQAPCAYPTYKKSRKGRAGETWKRWRLGKCKLGFLSPREENKEKDPVVDPVERFDVEDGETK